MSEHKAAISWARGARGFGFEEYSRDHAWSFDGGAGLAATAAPAFRGNPERVDPEEAFVAAVASCHMLTFLALASRKRLVVDRYDDDATGFMEKNADGKLAITRVVLRPRIAFAGAPPVADELARLHERAHENCFIANSVRSEIVVEASDAASALPNAGEALAPVLARVPREQQPLLIALAERTAAERYRAWAGLASEPEHRSRLLACAEREEEIARRVEALYPEAAAIQRDLLAKHPELPEIGRRLFAGRPLADQLRIQAAGERLGAATWRSFARHAPDAAQRDTLLACATLEEESALVLEALFA
jgi:organic hydroperoxide reductase OsmC/OhrA